MTTRVRPADAARTQLLAGALALAALAVPALLARWFDPRLLDGASVWDKPLKFDLSLGLHLLTLVLLLAGLDDMAATGRAGHARRAAVTVTACAVAEALYITLQAARGRPSHYNRDTPLEAFLYYGAMGPGALAILAATFVLGVLLWRHADPHVPPGLRRGAALGLMLGSALTLVVVVPLSSGMAGGLGHWVGGPRTDVAGLPLVGWATRGGDLRVPHFFATHLMQALPLAGWIADRLAPRHAIGWVHAAAAVGSGLVAFTFWQALAGQPFLAR